MPISQRLKKLIKSLHQKPHREQNGLFVAEGEKLAQELINSDFVPELLVYKESPSREVIEVIEHYAMEGVPIYSAPKHQFDQLCDTKSPQNILAVVNVKHHEPDVTKNFVILDGINDPGNVGTIIRTANWFGFDQIFLGRDCADEYNPKTVRATMGAIFKSKVIQFYDIHDLITQYFPKHKIFGASLDATKKITEIKPKSNFGLVFGSESHGISDEIKNILTDSFLIEGKGSSESLNVAVAAGISMFHFTKFI